MTNTSNTAAAPTTGRKLTKISADGKRETFKNHSGLIRSTISGEFSARFRVGKAIRQMSLETTDKATAIKNLAKAKDVLFAPQNNTNLVAHGIALFKHETATAHELSEKSRAYRLRCLDRILKSWKDLPEREPKTLTVQELQFWAMNFGKKKGVPYAPQFFNNCVAYFRLILKLAGLKQDDNPAFKVKRRGIPPKKLELPTISQFNQILAEIETAGAEQSKDRADYVRFLAFSGCRWAEAKEVRWSHVDLAANTIQVNCVKRRATSSEARTRLVPIVPAMRQLLERLTLAGPNPNDLVCKVTVCKKPFVRACRRVGLAPLTHHSMRHLFATFCIEAEIDVPTVSRWLGHSDGGALAMRTYGHLRQEHSQKMAQRVTFGVIESVASVPVPDALLMLKSANETQPLEAA